jgi:hypothetical protein
MACKRASHPLKRGRKEVMSERWTQGDCDGYEQYQEQLAQDRADEQAYNEAQEAEAHAKALADEEQAAYTMDTHALGVCLRFANGETCIGCGDKVNGEPLEKKGA